jgi:hypothetical protein
MLTKQFNELNRQADVIAAATVNNRLKVRDLGSDYYAFGGHGDVWGDTAHIAQSGEPVTMCGRPMLSSNWVAIEGMEHIGCPKCIAAYQQLEVDKCVMA